MTPMPEWLRTQWRELVAKQQQHPHSREPGEDDGDPMPAWTPSPKEPAADARAALDEIDDESCPF